MWTPNGFVWRPKFLNVHSLGAMLPRTRFSNLSFLVSNLVLDPPPWLASRVMQ